jgi:hypothetical protein
MAIWYKQTSILSADDELHLTFPGLTAGFTPHSPLAQTLRGQFVLKSHQYLGGISEEAPVRHEGES